MKRALTKRGLAMLNAGTHTLEALMASEEFSTPITEGMKVQEVSLGNVMTITDVAPPPSEEDDNQIVDPSLKAPSGSDTGPTLAQLTTQVAELTAQLGTASTALTEATTALEATRAELATAKTTLEGNATKLAELTGEVDALRPVAVAGVRALQIKLGKPERANTKISTSDLVATYAQLAASETTAFPRANVSVVDEEDDRSSTQAPGLTHPSFKGAFKIGPKKRAGNRN